MNGPGLQKIGFGGGCHWCTEAVFQALRGVARVDQGFIASAAPDEAWSEAVIVSFDPGEIGLDVLIDIHLRTHSSASDHQLRGKYRSAVYTFSGDQAALAARALDDARAEMRPPPITRALPFKAFKPSDPRFQNYYATRGDRPFCRTYIDPKLVLLRREYGALTRA